ncbi:MAG: ATP-NAD kinase family protein [Candidatus Altiarchaeota archaeon]
MKKLGFLVNPIAGMGGSVGLKGTDELVGEAVGRGAVPHAADKALRAVRVLKAGCGDIMILSCGGIMGACVLGDAGVGCDVVYEPGDDTSRADTIEACRVFLGNEVDLILFCGGDGTARDVYEVVSDDIPVLGIPAGVKMHSSVFAVNPEAAGEMVLEFLNGDADLKESEVMDVDEEAYRSNRLETRVYGYAVTPYKPMLVQDSKTIYSGGGEEEAKRGIAEFAAEFMRDGSAYILGAGTTVNAIADRLGVEKTLLGVDVVKDGKLIARDVGERELLGLMEGFDRVKIMVSPIGAQGFVFGRGNQQISPEVIRKAGVRNIIIVATPHKLSETRYLRVDTGDACLDKELSGYQRVVIGYQMAQRKDVVSYEA